MSTEFVPAAAPGAGYSPAMIVQAGAILTGTAPHEYPDPNRFIYSMSILNGWDEMSGSSTPRSGGVWGLNDADIDENMPPDHPSVWFQVGVPVQDRDNSLPLVALATVADTYVTRCFGSSVPTPLSAVAAEIAKVLSDVAPTASVVSVVAQDTPSDGTEPLGRIRRERSSFNDFVWDGPSTAEIRLTVDVAEVSILRFGWYTSIISEIIRMHGCSTSAVVSWQASTPVDDKNR